MISPVSAGDICSSPMPGSFPCFNCLACFVGHYLLLPDPIQKRSYCNIYRRLVLSFFHSFGSGWMVQVLPTDEGRDAASANTTHGSGWIVQVLPTSEQTVLFCDLLLSTRAARERHRKPGGAA